MPHINCSRSLKHEGKLLLGRTDRSKTLVKTFSSLSLTLKTSAFRGQLLKRITFDLVNPEK